MLGCLRVGGVGAGGRCCRCFGSQALRRQLPAPERLGSSSTPRSYSSRWRLGAIPIAGIPASLSPCLGAGGPNFTDSKPRQRAGLAQRGSPAGLLGCSRRKEVCAPPGHVDPSLIPCPTAEAGAKACHGEAGGEDALQPWGWGFVWGTSTFPPTIQFIPHSSADRSVSLPAGLPGGPRVPFGRLGPSGGWAWSSKGVCFILFFLCFSVSSLLLVEKCELSGHRILPAVARQAYLHAGLVLGSVVLLLFSCRRLGETPL